MTTKLATVQIITNIEPIEGADKIEKCTVLGWQCVVKKGDFKVGDACIYCEIDSMMPVLPIYDFLAQRKYRIRTIKLKSTISQGLVLPLMKSSMDSGYYIHSDYIPSKEYKCKFTFNIGDDVTEILGITKYLSPSERNEDYVGIPKKKHGKFIKFMTRFQWFRKMFHIKSKSFPNWISQTDEEKLQNIPHVLKDKNTVYYITEKIDYQSGTWWYKKEKVLGLFNKEEFGICSRSVRKFELDNSNWSQAARLFNIKQKLKDYNKLTGKNICIQGELGSIGCQGNKYGLTNFELFVFNVFDIDKKEYYTLDEMIAFCLGLGFAMVPILNSNFKLLDTVQEMVELSKGNSLLANIPREGIVVRSINDHRKSFKVINPEFLLKYNC